MVVRLILSMVLAVLVSGLAAKADDAADAAERQRAEAIVRDYFAKAFPFQPKQHANIGCDTGPCVVEPWRLPPRAPFRRNGKVLETILLESGRVGGQRIVAMLRRFPDAMACLETDVPGEQGWDLTRVRWSALRTDLALEVCLFRLADALRDPDRAVTWFDAMGLRAYALEDRTDPGWWTVHANWGDSRALLSRLSTTRLFGLPAIDIGFSPEGRVRGVRLIRNYE